MNRFQGINSGSLCSQVGRYDNPIPTRFLDPIEWMFENSSSVCRTGPPEIDSLAHKRSQIRALEDPAPCTPSPYWSFMSFFP